MAKKFALILLVAVLAIIIINFSASDMDSSLVFACDDDGVVHKAPGEAFTVKITFKNTGKTEGTWSVNIAFEDNSWVFSGIPQNLILQPEQTETLIWNGFVPANATVDSMARLVVYYNDSFKALNWWIHVVPGAELTIESSSVE